MSEPTASPRFTNRLAGESSAYLRQHAHNPVDWYPWGEEAFARARAEGKPVLLSIGYSACHWCHVMAHESFEDETTAELMNQRFVNIKVDRDERPDLDEVYMTAVQLLTHHGGWPMTVVLTPDGEPYFGGTYFPPDDRHGMPSFRTVLAAVSEAYAERKDEVLAHARTLVEEIRKLGAVKRAAGAAGAAGEPDSGALRRAYGLIAAEFDPVNGGFGHAPKFPSPLSLSLCLRRSRATGDREALRIVTWTLERMAAGGIHDHLGGGFHRYTVDARWLVPHFEKMLYDNALLLRLYVEAWQATGDAALRTVAERTLGWVRREMTGPGGGFYATLDADSEGEEGKFYVWTPGQVAAVLGKEDAELFCRIYDVTAHGNFEHETSVLNLPRSPGEHARDLGLERAALDSRLAAARDRLFTARERRPRPFRDEKVIVAWNGLMLGAMAFAARALGSAADLEAAVETGEFLWRELRPKGRLLHCFQDGEARIPAFLDDVAALGQACLELYQATHEGTWLERAAELGETLLEDFADAEAGGFFYTASGSEPLIARSKNPHDNAVPGGNSLAVRLLQGLAALSGERRFAAAAERTLVAFKDGLARAPQAFAHMAEALDAHLAGPTQVAIAGRRSDALTERLTATVFSVYHPDRVVALVEPGAEPMPLLRALAADKTLVEGRPAAYVCRRFACERPVLTPEELAAALGAAERGI